jgi:hypothetical protein
MVRQLVSHRNSALFMNKYFSLNVLVTGIWDLFDYDYHSLPYKIYNQPDPDELCLEIGENMDLVFNFLPVARKNADLVWRYEISLDCLHFACSMKVKAVNSLSIPGNESAR